MNTRVNKIFKAVVEILFVIAIAVYAWSLTPKVFQNDTFYTIKIGELISNTTEHPTDLLPWHKGLDMKDHFSYHGIPYTYPHWLYDLLTYKVYSLGGFNAVYILTCALAVLLGLTLYVTNVKLNKSKSLSFLITIASLYGLKDFIAARAQLVTFILFILTILFIELFIKNKRIRYVVPLIIIPILIANLHCAVWPFYFVLFLPYIASYLCYSIATCDYCTNFKKFGLKIRKSKYSEKEYEERLHVLNNKLEEHNKKVDEKCKGTYKIELSRQKNVKWLILILVICAFTGLCTPIKDVPYTYLIKTSEGNTTQNINEHLPLILAKNENMMISLTAVFGILIFSRAKIRLSDFFMLVGLVFLSFFSQRQTSMLIIIGNFILVRLLCGVLANIKKLMKMDKEIPQEWLFIKNFTMFAIIVGVSTITVFNIYQKSDDPFIDENDYPVQASEYINNTLIPEVGKQNLRLYNEYNYGSYLLYQNIPVFIDSRADLYTPEFNGKKGKDGKYVGKDVFSDFLDISNLSTPYEEKFEEYEITHVMTYRNSKLNTLLEKDSNYSLIYGDDYFKIYEREI